MMRELSSLHATMTAANEATQQRGKRGAQHSPPLAVSLSSDTVSDASGDTHHLQQQQQPRPPQQLHHHHHHHQQTSTGGVNGASLGGSGGVKQEDMQPSLSLVSRSPAPVLATKGKPISFTTTLPLLLAPGTYKTQIAPIPVKPVVHPFCDPGQSFLTPSATSPLRPHPQPLRPLPLHPHPHPHISPTPASSFSPQGSHSSNSVSPVFHRHLMVYNNIPSHRCQTQL